MKHIYDKIKEYKTIIIHGHKRPDGDCYGAQFGLKNIIENTYPEKDVYVVGQKSDFVDYVGQMDVISDDVYKGALSIVVDTATSERISEERYTLGKEIIKIDHHIPIDQYGDYQWVDTSFPSCAQMIAYFAKTFDMKITKPGAVAMYTGILTDTGRFKYRGVSQLTHELAGMLLSNGADVEEIDQQLSKESLNVIRYKGFIYQNFITDNGFIYVKVSKDQVKEFGLTYEEASSVVNILGGIDGYPVWAILLEQEDNTIRVRLRSNGPDIDKVANQFKGGGHAKASGATLDNWEELPAFIKAVKEVI
ncbi:Phosphoesterase RecJ domain protein [Alteracholeplasma palmae J233]|uniref:Phosphoesterase RecJ domain protein n=1 Tax=Alteracholeplasma palmae (strain ATCC 49389 / J233) TaxID=1318466 RepID=U4KM15_ALTPJ|nr:bifunctional oligoribonuclease/PAP phosphatase NrnA [Alteracholeplasma palmae]CCV64993.1 Phosphoesterase RecJ domain protein [Alteracholeplasma palmae J233]